MKVITELTEEFLSGEEYLVLRYLGDPAVWMYRSTSSVRLEARGPFSQWDSQGKSLQVLVINLKKGLWEGYFFPPEELGTEIMIHMRGDL